eukprot:30918-Pelagococcus_subviridis.AAC.42
MNFFDSSRFFSIFHLHRLGASASSSNSTFLSFRDRVSTRPVIFRRALRAGITSPGRRVVDEPRK